MCTLLSFYCVTDAVAGINCMTVFISMGFLSFLRRFFIIQHGGVFLLALLLVRRQVVLPMLLMSSLLLLLHKSLMCFGWVVF